MDIRPANLGEGFAQEVISRRGKGATNGYRAWYFRLFHWRRTGLSYATVNTILRDISSSDGKKEFGYQVAVAFVGFLVSIFLAFPLLGINNLPVAYNLFGIHLAPHESHSSVTSLLTTFLSGFVWLTFVTNFIRMAALQQIFSAPLTERQAFEMRQTPAAKQPAVQNFGYLVQELVHDPNIARSAQPALRDAIRLLGEAVYKLTHTSIPIRSWNALEEKKQMATWKAGIESDPVVKAALLREVESYEQAIASAQHNATLRRRNEALLNELAAQIEALRIGLPAFYSQSGVDSYQLSKVSEKARAVAQEAIAQYHARAELDTASETVVSGRSL